MARFVAQGKLQISSRQEAAARRRYLRACQAKSNASTISEAGRLRRLQEAASAGRGH